MDDLLGIERMCSEHARRYSLETFPNQLEVITSEQMLDSYVSSGLPVNYGHWSFGKHFLIESGKYRSGANALAYEIVLNTNPCIAYLMEGNSLAMQALVIPHACFGHNSFSKGNYLFQQWTQPDAILDYMLFARNYVADCEERHGAERVEQTLDALHALRDQGLDKYKRPRKLDTRKERAEQARRLSDAQETMRQAEYYSVVPRPRRPRPKRGGVSGESGGKHAVLPREARAQTRALAARTRTHRAQDRAVLLSAAPDPGDERGLGHLLASPPDQRHVRRRPDRPGHPARMPASRTPMSSGSGSIRD